MSAHRAGPSPCPPGAGGQPFPRVSAGRFGRRLHRLRDRRQTRRIRPSAPSHAPREDGHVRSGARRRAGRSRTDSLSHPLRSPAARPKAIAVSTYGATTTVRPSASAGRISQRSRNARSAAYSSSSVRADGAPASSSATARSWNMPRRVPAADAASTRLARAGASTPRARPSPPHESAGASTPSTAISARSRGASPRLTAALRRRQPFGHRFEVPLATTAAARPRETARGSGGAARRSTARRRR